MQDKEEVSEGEKCKHDHAPLLVCEVMNEDCAALETLKGRSEIHRATIVLSICKMLVFISTFCKRGSKKHIFSLMILLGKHKIQISYQAFP